MQKGGSQVSNGRSGKTAFQRPLVSFLTTTPLMLRFLHIKRFEFSQQNMFSLVRGNSLVPLQTCSPSLPLATPGWNFGLTSFGEALTFKTCKTNGPYLDFSVNGNKVEDMI